MESSVKAHNCPNCGGTVKPQEEKCGWCCSYVTVKPEKINYSPTINEYLNLRNLYGIELRNPLKTGIIVIT